MPYRFEKTGALIERPAAMPGPGPYYSCLLALDGLTDLPFDYALYSSTDHHSGAGGIWLHLCTGAPTHAANWRSYDEALAAGALQRRAGWPVGNPIFQETALGEGHTETPHAGLVDGRVLLSYHKNHIPPGQASLMAHSPDGVHFERIGGAADGGILPYDPTDGPGGHTGYFRWGRNVFAGIPERFVGWSLYRGGDAFRSALWVSDDARRWRRQAMMQPVEGAGVPDPERLIIWHEIDPASLRRTAQGDYAAIGCTGTRASGAAARVVELCELYLAEDGVTQTREARPLLERGAADAPDAEELSSPTIAMIGDTAHLLYVGAAQQGGVNTVMGAVGRWED